MKAIIPVAGNGTRIYPLGVTTPKCLISILNKPLIVWTLENLAAAGVNDVIIIISAGTLGQRIKDFFETDFKNFEVSHQMNVSFAIQEQQLGTAHVLQMTQDMIDENEQFLFFYGDDLYGQKNIEQLLESDEMTLLGLEVEDPSKWGIFQVDEASYLQKLIEKPTEPVGNLANIGCMKLNATIFDLFDQIEISERGEYELTDSLSLLAEQEKIKVKKAADFWQPIGYPWHILDATEMLLANLENNVAGNVEENVVIDGNVELPASSTIKQGTRIEGNVLVGENVTIGPNAYIRGNTTIGDNSKVGFSVEVKNSVIGKNTFISHLAYIGDSILGDNVNIPAGCVATNFRHDEQNIQTAIKGKLTDTGRNKFGTVIGDNAKLGAGTVIYPGRKIWPNKTTLPNESVKRDVTD